MMPDDRDLPRGSLVTLPDLATLALCLQLAYEFLEAHGRKMTAAELQIALKAPGR